MTGTGVVPSSQDSDTPDESAEVFLLPCVLSFNASDPTGAGGLTGDAMVIASVGAHALPVATGAYLRDSRETIGHAALDDSFVIEQARMVAEDIPLQVIKVGFAGSTEAVAAIAAFAADYADTPLIAYMPDLSWWDDHEIDSYLDAFRDLLLPQTAVLVGNNSTLRHWLLPESSTQRYSRTTDLARAAAQYGVSYVLATGLALPGGQIGNVLASPQAELVSQSFERIDASFVGSGDILSAALAALLAMGSDLNEATAEALQYLDQALDHGFHPGMGHAVADRLFWAETDDPLSEEAPELGSSLDIPNPFNETKH
ncbi:bifunctional hydroxymethylpyrimidine kinase/phosphomethylpyrimidine kinase [Ottowia thiooxydans]|uniref:bifunctional hydroxymethylpyrimidine kinase/phosphomethylpyrimidine kinase n=1 Tax=Ottowia thiooxydans TaxID=219182 RepID=UPI0004077DDD|nr:bifunctional hydroxymethylpyrimidine kinase/phosphomethylpyrimidine kinase [Ottowia thiooxydans]